MRERDHDVIDRYLAGEASLEECERAERARGASAIDRLLVHGIRRLRAEDDAMTPVFREAEAEMWTRLTEAMAVPVRLVATEPGSRRVFRLPASARWTTMAKRAAALIAAVGLATLGWRLARPEGQGGESPSPSRVVATRAGERVSIHLPDGTGVMLGPGSILRMPGDFGRPARTVTLEGEGYFEVSHDAHHPFVVWAGGLVARDLGTAFIIRAYPDDGSARVVVREGKVGIAPATAPAAGHGDHAATQEASVAPGQLGRLSPTGAPIVERADTAVAFAWTEGRLVLRNVPLRDAVVRMSRWFGLDFRLAGPVRGDLPVTATFRTQLTDEDLEALAASLGLHAVRSGGDVTLQRGGSPR